MPEIKFVIANAIRVYFRTTLNIKMVEKVTGVNSNVDQETHVLLWDFDGIELAQVADSLRVVQKIFDLPKITIVWTGKPGGYHAYCFKSCTFLEVRTIIAATPNVDKHFLMAGIGRGYFTLRFSEVEGREFGSVGELPSEVLADLSYKDVNCFIEYTKMKG